MKQLTRELPATSLLETIVSSIIFMILFVIATHALTNLLVHENRQPDYLVIEKDMKKCRLVIEKEGIDENKGEVHFPFPWGKIRISATPYKGNILMVEIASEIDSSGQSIGYYFLHVNP